MGGNSAIKDIQSEAIIISTVIHHPVFVFHVPELKHTHFYDKQNRVIFWSLSNLIVKKIDIDDINILSQIKSNKMTADLFGITKESDEMCLSIIREVIDLSSSLTRETVEEFIIPAQNVIDNAFRRDMLEELKKCESFCKKYDGTNIREDIQTSIQKVLQNYSTTPHTPMLADILDVLWDEISTIKRHDEIVEFFIEELNKFCKMERCETFVLAARQKRGKSIFMMNCAKTLLDAGKSVLYIDTELQTKKFLMRFMAHIAQVEFWKIREQQLSGTEHTLLKDAREWIRKQEIKHIYMPEANRTEVINCVYTNNLTHNFDALIFDYIKGNSRTRTSSDSAAYVKSQELGELVDCLHNSIAGKMRMIVVAAAQLTKGGELADSAKIARNCSTLVLLERKDAKTIVADGGEDFGNMTLFVRDNRNGAISDDDGFISIALDGNRCTFNESAQPEVRRPY
jgi:replicative DNA helicase